MLFSARAPQKTLAMDVAAGWSIAAAVDRTKIDSNSVAARTLFQAIQVKNGLKPNEYRF